MTEFVTELLTTITATSLWGAIEPAAPIIGVAILFSIGYMILRKATKGVARGKTNL